MGRFTVPFPISIDRVSNGAARCTYVPSGPCFRIFARRAVVFCLVLRLGNETVFAQGSNRRSRCSTTK
ncbi:unnamed protein product (mitochondrion) [Plasmodiophora brassicae]|uniref:Uncharacterized protein n=1 Tax=Plasmodiophora brassicae TaxID=37360 RepID=A0A3P3Y5C2_PLABS|nr:unnamed protein product [Plasmodiophora brassicae]